MYYSMIQTLQRQHTAFKNEANYGHFKAQAREEELKESENERFNNYIDEQIAGG